MINSEGVVNSIVVLIDQFTKATVSSITYDVLSKHVVVITDIKELSEEHYKSHLVIFEPAVSVIVTPEILREVKRQLDLEVSLVYQSEEIVAMFRGLLQPVKADYSDISWNFVYAVVNNDLAILEPYQRSLSVLDSFKAVREKIPEDISEYIERFRGSYMDMVAATNRLLDENERLRQLTKTQEAIGKQTIAGLLELKTLLDQEQDKVHAYETLLSKSYDVIFSGFYPERPRVLYVKHISHVAGIDTFLSVLFAVLSKQYKLSCKVVKLVDSSNALYMRYVPNNYTVITDSYDTSEILGNDFIMKLGAYNIMFDTLFLNRSGLDYLIVHDMRGTAGTAIDPMLIDLKIHEVSADYAVLGEFDNVLSDSGKNIMFPWSFKECQKYTGSNVVKLVNHPTVGAVIDLLL